MDAFVDFILRQDPTLVVVLLMAVSALENVFPPVPADVAAALGAFWAARAGHSAVFVGTMCFVANQVSAIGVYAFARSKGDAILKSPMFVSLMPDDVQRAIARNIDRFGGLGIFVSRFLPGIRAAVLPFAAIHGLSPARALLPAASASLLWYAALTMVGSTLGLAYEDVRATVARLTEGLGVIGTTLLVAALFLLWRARKRAKAKTRESA